MAQSLMESTSEVEVITCNSWLEFCEEHGIKEHGIKDTPEPIPIRLHCPSCAELHIDEGEFATKPHHTHACQFCGEVWRPAIVFTVGVRFLPGFKSK